MTQTTGTVGIVLTDTDLLTYCTCTCVYMTCMCVYVCVCVHVCTVCVCLCVYMYCVCLQCVHCDLQGKNINRVVSESTVHVHVVLYSAL